MTNAADGPTTAIDVYWRPGCPYCMSLKRSLRRRRVPMRLHDIWADPEAAAVVRRAAQGDETVTTVVVAGHALVNPSAREVEALVEQLLPELVTDRGDQRRSWFGRRR